MNRPVEYWLLQLMLMIPLIGCSKSSDSTAQQTNVRAGGYVSHETPRDVRVTVCQVERKTLLRTVQQPGQVEAFESTPLFARVTAYVDVIHVNVGDSVTKGQELALLSAPELIEELRQKEALLALAEAETAEAGGAVKVAEAAVRTARSKLDESHATLQRTDAAIKLTQSEHRRKVKLVESKAINSAIADESLNKLEIAETAHKEALARLESDKSSVDEAESRLVQACAAVKSSEARLMVAKVNVARAKAVAEFTVIRAPFDGVVAARGADPGHLVQPGSASAKPLFVIDRVDKFRTIINVSELDTAAVDVGDKAILVLQALENITVEGKVARTNWSLDPSSRTLRIEIEFPHQDRVRPGMYADVRLELEERIDVPVLPLKAVISQGKETFCYVIRSGKATKTPLVLGLRTSKDVEIQQGLTGGEQVAITSLSALRDGRKVTISTTPLD